MLILSTNSLYKYGLNRIFHFAKKLRFEGVEVSVNEIADTHSAEYLGQLSKQYDLPIRAIEVPRKADIEKTRQIFDLAEELKVPTVVIRSPEWSDFAYTRWVQKIATAAAPGHRAISIENPPLGDSFLFPKYAFGNINDFRGFKSVCLSTSHLFSRELDLMRIYALLKKNVSHIHLANANRHKEYTMLDNGALPLESFLTRLKADGYQGDVSIKVDFAEMGGDDEKLVEKNLEKCRAFYEEFFLGKGK